LAKIITMPVRTPISVEIADLAYSYWLARCFRNGSPEKDLLQAVLEVTFGPGRNRTPNRRCAAAAVEPITGTRRTAANAVDARANAGAL